jgi:hypothetical protein
MVFSAGWHVWCLMGASEDLRLLHIVTADARFDLRRSLRKSQKVCRISGSRSHDVSTYRDVKVVYTLSNRAHTGSGSSIKPTL